MLSDQKATIDLPREVTVTHINGIWWWCVSFENSERDQCGTQPSFALAVACARGVIEYAG